MDTSKFDKLAGNDTPADNSAQNNNAGADTTANDKGSSVAADDPKSQNGTYNEEEINDVNAITVTVPDTQTPIVVFFGSQASGKTLALMRMIRWVESQNCQAIPEEIFRPKTDTHYPRMCRELKNMVYSQYTPGGTDVVNFMLVKILDPSGRPVCQILEAPGEHYFDGTADISFPTYINFIRTTPNRKVWVFFVEQGWGQDQGERNLYAQKIKAMQSLLSPNDKVVFLFNKADRYRGSQYLPNGRPNAKLFFQNIAQQYPGIFDRYSNSGFFSNILFGKYNFKAVCFSSGMFNKTANGREIWTLENDSYCQDLWNAVVK